ncbi:MAG: hypothetical protein WCH01_12485, partial [Methylococcaceae bacterium]
MKRVSLEEVSKKGLADKEKFIYDQDKDIPVKRHNDIDVKTYRGRPEKGDTVIGLKKTSCSIPSSLWVKYKTYELEQVKQGNHVSLNGLIVALLIEKLQT